MVRLSHQSLECDQTFITYLCPYQSLLAKQPNGKAQETFFSSCRCFLSVVPLLIFIKYSRKSNFCNPTCEQPMPPSIWPIKIWSGFLLHAHVTNDPFSFFPFCSKLMSTLMIRKTIVTAMVSLVEIQNCYLKKHATEPLSNTTHHPRVQ